MSHELSPDMDWIIVNSETTGSLCFLEVAAGIYIEMATRHANVAVELPICTLATLTYGLVKPARWEHCLLIFVVFVF